MSSVICFVCLKSPCSAVQLVYLNKYGHKLVLAVSLYNCPDPTAVSLQKMLLK